MIELTRLNGHKFFVNSNLIKYVEAAPDTTLTLVTGEKLLVSEACRELAELIMASRVQLLRTAWPGALPVLPVLDISSVLHTQESAVVDHHQ